MLKPASIKTAARCPAMALSGRFVDAGHPERAVRCVLEDTHSGRCRAIDGSDLTEDAISPRARYYFMGLTPPDRLDRRRDAPSPAESDRLAVFEAAWASAPDTATRVRLAAAFLGGSTSADLGRTDS
jgi:hypothetical protein